MSVANGGVIGVNTAVILCGQDCVRRADVDRDVDISSLLRHGRVRRSYLGVAGQESAIPVTSRVRTGSRPIVVCR